MCADGGGEKRFLEKVFLGDFVLQDDKSGRQPLHTMQRARTHTEEGRGGGGRVTCVEKVVASGVGSKRPPLASEYPTEKFHGGQVVASKSVCQCCTDKADKKLSDNTQRLDRQFGVPATMLQEQKRDRRSTGSAQRFERQARKSDSVWQACNTKLGDEQLAVHVKVNSKAALE